MSDPLERLTAALAGHYTIERELGRGGNAVVYLAHDKKHDRKVAVKVLQSEIAESVKAERFLREIQIAAKLTHPRIVAIHDSGQANAFLYYVMPYIEGDTLRSRLNREPQLPLEEALKITGDVGEALAYAHGVGVIHRDIKPENILLSPGGALLADFGIARALTAAGGGTITEAGAAIGTPIYMSPEQAAASRTVDARSDIYSLGCVTYEMLAGHPPFGGTTAQEILARHSLDPVPSLKAARNAIPRSVEWAVTKALAKQPADRFATAAGFVQALTAPPSSIRSRPRRPLYVALTLTVIVVASVFGWGYFRARDRSIAVMPFTNLTTDWADVYFSEGITEDIVDALGRVEGLRVVPISAEYVATHAKGITPQTIGDQLHVAKVLEGSVRREGTDLRILARILNVDGTLWWSQTYPRKLRNMFAVQEELAHAIVGALQVKLGRAETTLVRRPTENVDAYDLYLRGRYFWYRRTAQDVKQAIQYFEAAVAKDSAYALGYSGLADAYWSAGSFGYLPLREAQARESVAAVKAVSLDPMLAEAHTSLARLRDFVEWDLAGAEREYRRAIALNPKYPLVHGWYGQWLATHRRYDDGIGEGKISLQLDPLNPVMLNNMGVIYNASPGHDDDAIRVTREAIAIQPDWWYPHRLLGNVLFRKGLVDDALKEFQEVKRLASESSLTLAYVGAIYARSGRREEARKILNNLRSRAQRNPVAEAVLYCAFGDQDAALAELGSAVESRALPYPGLLRDQWFDSLRSDPRYVVLLQRVGLEPS